MANDSNHMIIIYSSIARDATTHKGCGARKVVDGARRERESISRERESRVEHNRLTRTCHVEWTHERAMRRDELYS